MLHGPLNLQLDTASLLRSATKFDAEAPSEIFSAALGAAMVTPLKSVRMSTNEDVSPRIFCM